jgi:hypothetical protein
MKILPVSFGKVVKVLAPHHEAVRIANAANGDPTVKPEVQKQIQHIFNDTYLGHALAVTFNDEENVSYILSGKESRQYTNDLYHKALYVIDTKRTCPLDEALRKVVKSNQDFCKRTRDLIERKKEDFALKVSPKGEKIEIVK